MQVSHISKKEIPNGEEVRGKDIREGIVDLITSKFPDFIMESFISNDELNKFRRLYLTALITEEKGELAVIDSDVMAAIKNNAILSENMQDEMEAIVRVG